MKKEDKLGDLSMQLSVEVLNMCKELKNQGETVISNQISRSATSICANIAESKYAHGRADFIATLQISLKEAAESVTCLNTSFLEILKINMRNFRFLSNDCNRFATSVLF